MEVLTACRRGLVVVRRVPPHFSILPESTEVASGGAVNLTCVAVGSPMPQVKWRLGAVELTPENSVPIGKNVLQLTDVRETATYTCVAASDLGNIEYDAEVRVKGKRRRTLPCHVGTYLSNHCRYQSYAGLKLPVLCNVFFYFILSSITFIRQATEA